jgi:hypothetical protein
VIGDEIRKALKGLSVIALLVGCSPGTTRPAFEPLPEARTGRVELEVPAATERLAQGLSAQGIPVSRVTPRDGYLETAWFEAGTGQPAGGRTLGDDRVRVRAWVRPAGRHASQLTVEAVYRPFADPSAPARELERSVEYSHPVRARIRSAFAALGAGGEEPDAIALAERRAARAEMNRAVYDSSRKQLAGAPRKVAADSARTDTISRDTVRTDTTASLLARADTTRPAVSSRDTTAPASRADTTRPAARRPDTAAARTPAPVRAVPTVPVRPETPAPRDTASRAVPPSVTPAYSVQVAATADTGLANHAAARLRDLGLRPRIVREGGLLKVRTPNYPSSGAARTILGRVKAVFPDAFVTSR